MPSDRAVVAVFDRPVCGEPYGFDSQGAPYHFGCAHGGDHDACDPDDRHLPR